ncbi:MAG: Ig-like domain-containing protein [Candidatus Zixiibacteriota bacterium]
MTSLKPLALLPIMGAVWLISGGCNDSNDMTGSRESTAPAILRVHPPDGAVDVPSDASLAIRFNMPMDTASVHAGLHFTGGADMQSWMDSLDHMGGMRQISPGQQEQMMQWLDSLHIAGRFLWNESFDSCTYRPDSAMPVGTDHMIFLFGPMKSREGVMMNMGGSMMMSDTGFSYHFTTAL